MRHTMSRTLAAATLGLAALTAGCESDSLGPRSSAPLASPSAGLSVSAVDVVGSVTGSAHLIALPLPAPLGLATRDFTVSALEYRDGLVRGGWQIVAGATILHGDIDCLHIAPDGASARISGIVTDVKFSPTFVAGTAFAMELFDNGNGASGDPDVTTEVRAFRDMSPAVGRAFCEDGTVPTGADLNPMPTDEGNVTIRLTS